jgi:hypothetical protein
VKWKPGGASDDLYAKRQQERESLGAQQLPRLFKSVMSPDRKRTGYFLADLKGKEKSWIEICDDAMQPEEIRAARRWMLGRSRHSTTGQYSRLVGAMHATSMMTPRRKWTS